MMGEWIDYTGSDDQITQMLLGYFRLSGKCINDKVVWYNYFYGMDDLINFARNTQVDKYMMVNEEDWIEWVYAGKERIND